MYIINSQDNSLTKIEKCDFRSLGFDERNNRHEWIAKEPSSLGEELLIIQKEFDGFSDTRERLDLLALDKFGNLVIIENKLDDSGRDVTWQAIKYASYCSSLTKQDIIEIYQKYLGTAESAEESLSEFFGGQDISDIEINVGNSQRIFLVAANFRKEVTSSVMWLLNFNMRIKCFKVTPFKYNDQVLLEFDQIIPIKEADEYTIKVAAKNQSEAQSSDAKRIRRNNRMSFWTQFIEYNKNCNGLYCNSTPNGDNWLSKTIKGFGGVSINMVICQASIRTEVYISTGNKDTNKAIFNYLQDHQDEIHSKYADQLEWQLLPDKDSCRIRDDRENLSYLNPNDRDKIFEFFIDSAQRLMDTFSPYAKKFKKH